MNDEKNLQEITVIGDSNLCTGFRLAGIKSAFALDGLQAEKKIEELIGQKNVGIVIVSEKTMDGFDRRLKKKIERTAVPVILAVPDKDGPREQAESLKSMILRALGFELLK